MTDHDDLLTDDAAYLNALEHGPPATLDLYRRAYTTAGVPWPGDDEARRRHPITPPDTDAPADPGRATSPPSGASYGTSVVGGSGTAA